MEAFRTVQLFGKYWTFLNVPCGSSPSLAQEKEVFCLCVCVCFFCVGNRDKNKNFAQGQAGRIKEGDIRALLSIPRFWYLKM